MKQFVLFSLLLCSGLIYAEDNNPVVAVVNGSSIHKQEFLQAYRQQRMVVGTKEVTKKSVLNHLINREIGIQQALAQGLDKDPIVKRKMQDILFHALVSKDLEPLLKKIKVTEDDVKRYYKEHPEYRTAHILFRMRANPSKEEQQAAFNQAKKIARLVKNNPDKFAEYANKYSQTNLAPNGGDMGFQPSTALAPEYFAAIKGKRPGYIIGPIKTQFGYHIIKILGVKDYNEINKTQYRKFVYDQKRDKIIADYFAKQRKKAKIKIYSKNL